MAGAQKGVQRAPLDCLSLGVWEEPAFRNALAALRAGCVTNRLQRESRVLDRSPTYTQIPDRISFPRRCHIHFWDVTGQAQDWARAVRASFTWD